MGFSYTIINNGNGIGVVTNIGMNTEIGTIISTRFLRLIMQIRQLLLEK